MAPDEHVEHSKVLLLMGSSMIGSMVQLPGVGGGSQLATISGSTTFSYCPQGTRRELRHSCCGGDVCLYRAVGLLLSHHERFVAAQVVGETEKAEEGAAAGK